MKKKINRHKLVVVLCAMCVCIFFAVGCGKKGAPLRPVTDGGDIAVTDVTARMNDDGYVLLSWMVTGGNIDRFRIVRHGVLKDEFCPACPRRFSMLAEISVGSDRIIDRKDGCYQFVDRAVKTNFLYAYRVVALTSSNAASTLSETAEVTVIE